MKNGLTIRDAAERWVHEMNAIPQGMIEKLMSIGDEDIHEVTEPAIGDRVYAYYEPVEEPYGTIAEYDEERDLYTIEFDNGKEVKLDPDDFEVERDGSFPMWGTMWSFGDGCDDWWLEDGDGIRIMSECGFRIYESDEFGYFFGIDGAGYNFYDAHWIPLYKARGLQWHDPVAEQEYQMLSKGYKKEKLGANTYWMDKNNNVIEEVIKEEF